MLRLVSRLQAELNHCPSTLKRVHQASPFVVPVQAQRSSHESAGEASALQKEGSCLVLECGSLLRFCDASLLAPSLRFPGNCERVKSCRFDCCKALARKPSSLAIST